jgi:hypothetical protein
MELLQDSHVDGYSFVKERQEGNASISEMRKKMEDAFENGSRVYKVEAEIPRYYNNVDGTDNKLKTYQTMPALMYEDNDGDRVVLFVNELDYYRDAVVHVDRTGREPTVIGIADHKDIVPPKYTPGYDRFAHNWDDLKKQKIRADKWDDLVARGNQFIIDINDNYNKLRNVIDMPVLSSESMDTFTNEAKKPGNVKYPDSNEIVTFEYLVSELRRHSNDARFASDAIEMQAKALPDVRKATSIELNSDTIEFKGAKGQALTNALMANSALLEQKYTVGISKQGYNLAINIYNTALSPKVKIVAKLDTEAVTIKDLYDYSLTRDAELSTVSQEESWTVAVGGIFKSLIPQAIQGLVDAISGKVGDNPLQFASDDHSLGIDDPKMAITLLKSENKPDQNLTLLLNNIYPDEMKDIAKYSRVSKVFNKEKTQDSELTLSI